MLYLFCICHSVSLLFSAERYVYKYRDAFERCKMEKFIPFARQNMRKYGKIQENILKIQNKKKGQNPTPVQALTSKTKEIKEL